MTPDLWRIKPGELFTRTGKDVWEIYEIDHGVDKPGVTVKNLKTGVMETLDVGSPLFEELERLAPEKSLKYLRPISLDASHGLPAGTTIQYGYDGEWKIAIPGHVVVYSAITKDRAIQQAKEMVTPPS